MFMDPNYGASIYLTSDLSVERFYVAWRKTIRRIWKLDNRTHNALINLINGCLPVNLILEKRCIKFIWNRFNSRYELHKSVVKYSFYNGGSTLAENIRYLMYKYDISIDDWDEPLSYVVNKVLKHNTDHLIINNVFTANVIIDLCHERYNYYQYLLHLYSHVELKDFLKSVCTL